jgi:hypothetical protein
MLNYQTKKVNKVLKSGTNDIQLEMDIDGSPVAVDFEFVDWLVSPSEYDEPWAGLFRSWNASDGVTYEVTGLFYGHPSTHMEFDQVEDLEAIDSKKFLSCRGCQAYS